MLSPCSHLCEIAGGHHGGFKFLGIDIRVVIHSGGNHELRPAMHRCHMQKRNGSTAVLYWPIDQDCLDIRGEEWALALETGRQALFAFRGKGQALLVQKVDLLVNLREADLGGFAEPAEGSLIDQRPENEPVLVGLFMPPGG